MPLTLGLRPVQAGDEAFLFQVYASTRQAELAVMPWSDVDKQAFLRQQFAAQQRHYDVYYADASFQIVVADGVPVGRLYMAQGAHEVCVVDVALLPEHRRQGIGARLLNDVLTEAARDGKSVTVHVERFNPALQLYLRLGFEQVEDLGVYLRLSWPPALQLDS